MDERSRIAWLARHFAPEAGSADASPGEDIGVELGIGDDAAVLDATRLAGRLTWTIDEQVEGVHFRRELASFADIGWRSFMAAASDLAAMGARPWCALAALVLSADVADESFQEMAQGQRAAAELVGAPIVGGNLSRGPALSVATTLLGSCDRPVTRSGARVGDGLWLAGRLGLAAAGLRALGREGKGRSSSLDEAVAAWRRPTALIAEGRTMGAVAHAAVDVSDGLARDAGHVAEASEVALVLDPAALCADPVLAAVAAELGVPALELALHGGEDYALLVASVQAIPGFRRVGAVRAGRGLFLSGSDGELPLEPKGYDHFA